MITALIGGGEYVGNPDRFRRERGMSDKQKIEKIRQTLDNLDKEVADKEVTRDYWDGFCKVFNAVEVVLNENSK